MSLIGIERELTLRRSKKEELGFPIAIVISKFTKLQGDSRGEEDKDIILS